MNLPRPDRLGHLRPGPAESPAIDATAGPLPPPTVVVVCVPGQLRTEVVEACLRSRLPVRVIEHDPEDGYSYAHVLMDLWRWPIEWVVVEQDTIPPAGALRGMIECRHRWCTVPHWVGTHWEVESLGVARFALQLRRQLPELADQVVGKPAPHHPVRHWRILDTQLARNMEARGIAPHVHPGRTCHLHRYDVSS